MKRLLIIATLLFSTPALAQSFYAGGALGQSKAQESCDDLAGTGVSCEDTDTAWKVFGGYKFSRNFALEVGYADLGEVSASGFGIDVSAESSAFELTGVGLLPVANQFSVFARLGLYRAETEASTNFGFSAKETNTGLTFGFGARYDFGNIGVLAQWQRYSDVGGGDIGEDDVDVISVGALVRF